MSGGGSTNAGGPAPVPLLNAANYNFGNLPFAGVNQAQTGAFNDIANLNTNPGATYAPFYGYGANLGAQGNAATSTAAPWASAAFGSGGTAFNAGAQTYNTLTPYEGAALQAGFDPQGAQYARAFQQNQDQTRAANAAAGIATTPYGAAQETQSNQNFNLDWQQQQLQREALGASTASGLAGAANSALQGGTSALQGGYGLGSNIYSNLLGAGGNAVSQGLSTGQAIDSQNFNAQQQQFQDYLNYILGNTQNSQAFFGAANNTYGAAVNAAGVTNAGRSANNSLAGLTGLGQLGGSLINLYSAI